LSGLFFKYGLIKWFNVVIMKMLESDVLNYKYGAKLMT
jgi:hypothetical protein